MAEKKVGTVQAKPHPGENPLLPHRRLRAMYEAMVGLRLLDEWLAGESRRRKSTRPKPAGTRGEAAARVSTLIGLEKGDLVVDQGGSLAADYLLGVPVRYLAQKVRSEKHVRQGKAGRRAQRLEMGEPGTTSAEAMLQRSLGAALALKSQGATRAMVAIGSVDDLSLPQWSALLSSAARFEAPVVFLLMAGSARAGSLSARATRAGVPGIAVEADDAVALYRVAQESLVRIRMGGGPVLMECVRLSRRSQDQQDPIASMRAVLLAKGAADEAWLDRAETRLGTQLLGQLEASSG